jgi:hypothetical protein
MKMGASNFKHVAYEFLHGLIKIAPKADEIQPLPQDGTALFHESTMQYARRAVERSSTTQPVKARF